MDFDGRNVRQLTAHKSLSIHPERRAAAGSSTPPTCNLFPQIYSMNIDGSDKKEIPTGVDLNASPSLSPDGTQIAFAGLPAGQFRHLRRWAPTAATCGA